MKFNKKLSVVVIVSMVALSAVGCGKKGVQGNGNDPDRSGEGGKPIKMSQEEIQKSLESGAILPDTVK